MINTLEQCALCGSDSKLELSHIIPKMVVRKLKETSVGNIRNVDNPNSTVQDSEKHYMLCGTCEDLFSDYEKYFSDVMFQPYIKDEKTQYDYDDRLFYFLTSLSWRSLYWDLIDFVKNNVVGIDALECVVESERIMKAYLQKRRTDIGGIEHHIFFFDQIEMVAGQNKIMEEDLRPHATFHRSEFSYTVCFENERTYATLTNMMGLMVITLYSKGENELWENTQIYNGRGLIKAKNQGIKSVLCNEFEDIMERTKMAADRMSDKQKQKVVERLNKAGNGLCSSAVYKDWIDDADIKKS